MGTGEESRRGWHAGIKASAPLWRRTWSREKVCRISVSRCCSYIFLRFRTCGGNAGEAQAVRREHRRDSTAHLHRFGLHARMRAGWQTLQLLAIADELPVRGADLRGRRGRVWGMG